MGNPSSDTDRNVQITFNDYGVYPFSFSVQDGSCNLSYSDTLEVHFVPFANIEVDFDSVCQPKANSFFANAESQTEMTFLWDFGDGKFSTEPNPVHFYDQPGIYSPTLTIKVDSVCVLEETYQFSNPVVIFDNPKADFDVSPKETFINEPNVAVTNFTNYDNIYYLLDGEFLSDEPDFFYEFTHADIFSIKQIVTNGYNCMDTMEIMVKIKPEFYLYIPNAFTPNNDQLNQFFKPIVRGIKQYHFSVFNRWGEEIFYSEDPDEYWDGKTDGKISISDVYVYKVKVLTRDNNWVERKGVITLLK